MGPSPNTEPEVLLSAQGLAVRFGTRFALGPIDLEIKQGKHQALLGPSGSGKSTLLRLLTGHMLAEEGSIETFGQRTDLANQLLPGYKGIRNVRQDADLAAFQRIEVSIRRELAFLSEPDKKERLAELAHSFNCAELLAAKPEELSQGQRQRCALALAFASQPRIVALDEPFSNQDAWQRQQLLEAVRREAAQAGITLIICTHDWTEAAYLADNALFLLDGKVAYQGSTASLKSVAAPEAKALFGWISMDPDKTSVQYQLSGKPTLDSIQMLVEACIHMATYWLLVGASDTGTVWATAEKPVAVGSLVTIQSADSN